MHREACESSRCATAADLNQQNRWIGQTPLATAQIKVLIRAVASEEVCVLIKESDTTKKARHERLREWIRDAPGSLARRLQAPAVSQSADYVAVSAPCGGSLRRRQPSDRVIAPVRCI
jgi:hypothetical protein